MNVLDRRQLRPVEHAGLVRLGLPKDGGYVVPQVAIERSAILLSLGMKQDWSFERAFAAASPSVRVIGVDPSVGPGTFARQIIRSIGGVARASLGADARQRRKHVAALRNSLDYFRFFAFGRRHVRKRVAGLSSASDVTLTSLLQTAHAVTDHSVFLKMDIEGAEYAVVSEIVNAARLINCVVAEFHQVGKRAGVFNDAIAQLLDRFAIVHLHGNNYGPYDPENDFPTTVEITLLNRALIDGQPAASAREYPRPDLDCPNAPGRPDHRLRFD